MRIVNLISGKDLGGSKQAFVHYSDHLEQLGHEVISVIRSKAQVATLLNSRQLPWQTISYPRTQCIGFKQLAQQRLRGLLEDTKADLIIVHKPIDALLIKSILPNHCKLLLVLHSFTKKHLNHADFVLPVSQPLCDFMRQHDGIKPAMVMPNLVEMESNKLPTQPSPKRSPLRIANMGVMRRTKGQDLLIEALAIAQQEYSIDFLAKLAGKGRWYNKINKLIVQHHLQNKVSLEGWVANADHQAFFDQADVICVPSRQETFGMLVIEAMAQKKVVIATRCGGPEGIITDGENGLLTDINARSIAEKIAHVATMDTDEMTRLCENAYQHVQNTYSEAPFQARLVKMIAWVQSQ